MGGVGMADINLTQDEANALIEMEKQRVDDKEWLFPPAGDRMAIPLTSLDKRENFMLDVTRSQIKLTKATYQNRARQAIILMRLDLEGPPHRNPDDQEIPCPHLHIYPKDTATSGHYQPQSIDTRTPWTFFLHSRRSCNIATSQPPLRFRRGCFHDDGEGDRETSERLSRLVEGQNDVTRGKWLLG
jgi:hypothetical protein